MAARALPGRRCRIVEVMRRRIVARGLMALLTERVALGPKLLTVRIVAVAAAHAFGKHAALQEGAPVVDLVLHLTIGMVQAAGQQAAVKPRSERLAGMDIVTDLRPTGMTARAGLDLGRSPLSGHLRASRSRMGRRMR